MKKYIALREDRYTLLRSLEQINHEISLFETAVLSTLCAGTPVPGFKLKPGRMTRKVVDEATLVDLIKDHTTGDPYKTTLVGIPAIETMFKDAGFTKSGIAELISPTLHVTTGHPSVEYIGV